MGRHKSKDDNICTYQNKCAHAYKDVWKVNLVCGGEVCTGREEQSWKQRGITIVTSCLQGECGSVTQKQSMSWTVDVETVS